MGCESGRKPVTETSKDEICEAADREISAVQVLACLEKTRPEGFVGEEFVFFGAGAVCELEVAIQCQERINTQHCKRSTYLPIPIEEIESAFGGFPDMESGLIAMK